MAANEQFVIRELSTVTVRYTLNQFSSLINGIDVDTIETGYYSVPNSNVKWNLKSMYFIKS